MNNYSKKAKKALSTALVAVTTAWTIGASVLVAPLTAKAAVSAGTLVKASLPAVYYVGTDGKRYVFPNEKTYKTWFADFSGVQTITDAELASLVIGGNVTYRPGVLMVKITTDPKVYAVDARGTLRHVASESVAVALYGSNWNQKIHDVPDPFFVNYTLGSPINSASDFNPASATAAASSISVDKGLSAVSGAISVSLDASNPASTSIIADGSNGGQARIPTLALKFSGSGTVNTIKLNRIGINADSDIDNVYLYEGNNIIAEMQSISSGVITFNNSAGLFTLNGSDRVMTVKFDLDDNTSSGKTIGFSLASASNVVLSGGANAAGSFPFNGNLMTVASVSDLGRAQPTNVAVGSAVDPGAVNAELMRIQIQGSNQDLKMYKLRLRQIGSINREDLADIKLFDGAQQVGSTTTVDAAGYVTFDLSAAPYLISNGLTKQLSVKATVKSGSTRTIRLSLEKPYDMDVWDANYNVPISPDNGTVGSFSVVNGTSITVNSGSLTVSRSTTSPTGVVVLNGTNVMLAKFDVTAVGEPVKVSSLDFALSDEGNDDSGDANGSDNWTNLRNVRLMYDGAQVGTTQSSVADDTVTTVTVNFTVQPGSTHTIEVRADVAAASGAANAVADGETIRAYLDDGSSNGQLVNSLGSANVPSADTAGNTLTVTAGALTVVENTALGAVTVVGSQTNQRVGSWLMTTNTSQGVDVSTIVIDDDVATNSMAASFTNLTLKKDGVAIAPAVIPNTSDAAGTDYTFSLSPALSIPANSTVAIDLYADILSSETWTDAEDLRMVSSTATGLVTGTSISGTANVDGQDITISAAGTISLSVDGTSPVGAQHVMGSTNKTLGVWKFDANNTEDLTVSQIVVTNDNTGTSGSNGNVKNLKLFVDGVQVGSTIAALNGSGQAVFGGLSILVPRAGSEQVTLKADISDFTANPSGPGVLVRPEINLPATINEDGSGDTVVARGASGAFALVTSGTSGDKTAQNQFPYRATLSASLACQGSCSGRTRSVSDVIGKLSLTDGGVTDAQFRPAQQINDDDDHGDTGNDWSVLDDDAGTPAVAQITTVSLDGNAISWTTDEDWEVNDALYFSLPSGTDLTGYSRVSFWLYTDTANTDNIEFVVNNAADATSFTSVSVGTVAADTWTFIDLAMSDVDVDRAIVAADDFAGLIMGAVDEVIGSGGERVIIDELRFYNDKIRIDISGNLCDTEANCDTEEGDGTINNPTGIPVTLRNSAQQTVATGYYTGSATSGSASLFFGEDLTITDTGAEITTASTYIPTTGMPISIGSTALTYDIVADTIKLVDSDSTNTEILALSMDLGNAGGTGSSSVAGDFLWWDQGVSATSPINFVNLGTAGTPINISLGY